MDHKEIIKMIGGLLVGLVVLCFAIVWGGGMYKDWSKPREHVVKVESVEATDGSSVKIAVAKIQEVVVAGDAVRGAKLFKKKCMACHKTDAAAGNSVGSNLFGVFGRKVASSSGFKYSAAMGSKGGVWDEDSLKEFLKKPKAYIPGTKMGFAGFKKPQQVVDVVSYLKELK